MVKKRANYLVLVISVVVLLVLFAVGFVFPAFTWNVVKTDDEENVVVNSYVLGADRFGCLIDYWGNRTAYVECIEKNIVIESCSDPDEILGKKKQTEEVSTTVYIYSKCGNSEDLIGDPGDFPCFFIISQIDVCKDENTLYEGTCSSREARIEQEEINCKNGCVNGACVS